MNGFVGCGATPRPEEASSDKAQAKANHHPNVTPMIPLLVLTACDGKRAVGVHDASHAHARIKGALDACVTSPRWEMGEAATGCYVRRCAGAGRALQGRLERGGQ